VLVRACVSMLLPCGMAPLQAWKRYDYESYVGGILTMSPATFKAINGCVPCPRVKLSWRCSGPRGECLQTPLASVVSPPCVTQVPKQLLGMGR
jgi:hypothetical protein